MFIQSLETPNPHTLKFMPGVEVLKIGTKNFASTDKFDASPLAVRLFKVEGVTGVFLATDFISVTKASDLEWDYMKPIVLAAIMDHFMSGMSVINETLDETKAEVTDEITKQIIEIIDTRVRPAVAQDGGDIIFRDFNNGIVYLELQGACSGCPSSTVTLKSGIESMLKHYIPEVESVEQV